MPRVSVSYQTVVWERLFGPERTSAFVGAANGRYPSERTTGMTVTAERQVTIGRVWRNSDGAARAVDVASAEGGRFTANLDRGWISWAEPEVWADPEAHGLYRFTCPGHNGQVCFYGMCDEIRVRDLEGLRAAAGAHQETASDAYRYGISDGRTAAVFRDGPESCRPERHVAERHAAMYRNGWEHAYHQARQAS